MIRKGERWKRRMVCVLGMIVVFLGLGSSLGMRQALCGTGEEERAPIERLYALPGSGDLVIEYRLEGVCEGQETLVVLGNKVIKAVRGRRDVEQPWVARSEFARQLFVDVDYVTVFTPENVCVYDAKLGLSVSHKNPYEAFKNILQGLDDDGKVRLRKASNLYAKRTIARLSGISTGVSEKAGDDEVKHLDLKCVVTRFAGRETWLWEKNPSLILKQKGHVFGAPYEKRAVRILRGKDAAAKRAREIEARIKKKTKEDGQAAGLVASLARTLIKDKKLPIVQRYRGKKNLLFQTWWLPGYLCVQATLSYYDTPGKKHTSLIPSVIRVKGMETMVMFYEGCPSDIDKSETTQEWAPLTGYLLGLEMFCYPYLEGTEAHLRSTILAGYEYGAGNLGSWIFQGSKDHPQELEYFLGELWGKGWDRDRLLELAAGKYSFEASVAVSALVSHSPPEKVVLEILNRADDKVLGVCLYRMKQSGEECAPEEIAAVIAIVNSSDRSGAVRERAASVLLEAKATKEVETLLKSSDEEILSFMGMGLAWKKDERAWPLLRRLVSSRQAEVRARVFQGLRFEELKPKEDIELLRAGIHDKSPMVRKAVAWALHSALSDHKELEKDILSFWKSEKDPGVRVVLVGRFVWQGDSLGRTIITQAITDDDSEVQLSALRILQRSRRRVIPDAEGEETLIWTLEKQLKVETDKKVRDLATEVLKELKEQEKRGR